MKIRKQIYVLLLAILMCLTGCSIGKKQNSEKKDYEYSDYELNNEEPQFYMNESAATESGYYYIASSPVNSKSAKFLYYFDMVNKNSIPLCTKANCEHNDKNCDAYISDKYLCNAIWYYNQRLYMIERTADKDTLVSYDKMGRDKKDVTTLSVNGLTLNSTDNSQCVSHGKLYYTTRNEKIFYLYEVSLDGTTDPKLLKEYTSEYEIWERLALFSIDDKVYIEHGSAVSNEATNYIIDCYNISEDKILNVLDCLRDNIPIKAQKKNWNREMFFDNNENFYFVSDINETYCVNKLDLKTKENKVLYSIDLTIDPIDKKILAEGENILGNATKESYISLKGFDGKYLYLYEGVDITALSKTNNKELKNNLYVLDMDGNLIDTIEFAKNFDFSREYNLEVSSTPYFDVDLLGGDSRYMIIRANMYNLKSVEMSKRNMEKYISALNSKIGKKIIPSVTTIGVLDKKQLGTGSHNWINVTSE
jgi:hypothetical protein